MTILGISFGTTRTGIAVLKNGTLLDRNIHSFKTVWSEKKVKKIIGRYRQYILKANVTAVIVKIPPLHKHTKATTTLLELIELLAKEYYCDFDLITRTEIKDVLNLRTTDEMILFAKQLYPARLESLETEMQNEQSYHKKLYEAVLSAHIFKERHRIRKQREADTTQ